MARPPATLTFRALSALLAYPTEELAAAVPEIAAALAAEAVLAADARAALAPLLADLSTHDLFDLQERYVALFDRSRRLSLHLFEHIHGESRDRGQAMVDLARHYESGGLLLTANELPDYLPLFLEFLSTRPFDEARALLGQTAHVLTVLEERLAKRDAPYAAVLAALVAIAGAAADRPGAAEEDGEAADDLAALDAAWEETAVAFGPGDGGDGCSVDRLKIQLRAAGRDVRRHAG